MSRQADRQEARQWRRRRHRTDLVWIVGVLLGVVIIGYVLVTLHSLSQSLAAAEGERDALAAQVRRLGGTPVAGPSGRPGRDGSPGSAGPTVTITGAPGKDGKDGSPGPTGPVGSPGASGVPGSDSSIPGPSGAAGSPGHDATGAPGPAGADGKDGKDGRDGQTCPDGYQLEPAPDDPDALICRRTTASDPSSSTSPETLQPGLRRNGKAQP
jgi:hypothetical protein